MRKFFAASLFALIALYPFSLSAQQAATSQPAENTPSEGTADSQTQGTADNQAGNAAEGPYEGENLRRLVDSYATATLGFLVEDRCHLVADSARQSFTDDFLVLDKFIGNLIGAEAREKIVNAMAVSADNVENNPCDKKAFDFTMLVMDMTSQLANRIRMLNGEGMEVTPPDQPAIGAASASETPKRDEPKDVKKEEPKKAEPKPEPKPQPVTAKPASLPAANIPPGETKKEMKRRHKDEIIELRRKHFKEMKQFEDNEDAYDDPDEARRLLEERQEQEQDALLKRQQQEEAALERSGG